MGVHQWTNHFDFIGGLSTLVMTSIGGYHIRVYHLVIGWHTFRVQYLVLKWTTLDCNTFLWFKMWSVTVLCGSTNHGQIPRVKLRKIPMPVFSRKIFQCRAILINFNEWKFCIEHVHHDDFFWMINEIKNSGTSVEIFWRSLNLNVEQFSIFWVTIKLKTHKL